MASVRPSSSHAVVTTLSYIEFYCGIGGWTMALDEALTRLSASSFHRKYCLNRLAELDHANLCVYVLEHNFPSNGIYEPSNKRKRPQSFDIERLTLQQVHDWHADIWCMSPPCQPHTRQHENQDLDLQDPRSQSFLHLCQLLQDMDQDKLPQLLLMENVVGFEKSSSCKRWRAVLRDRNYAVAHFHLSPTQVGLPNDRPRYYCAAIRTQQGCDLSSLGHNADELNDCIFSFETNLGDNDSGPRIQDKISALNVPSMDSIDSETLPPLLDFLDPANDHDKDLLIPSKLLNKNAAWCFDWVTYHDTRSACFTHSYGKFVRGTGSVLYMRHPDPRLKLQDPDSRAFRSSWKEDLPPLEGHVRYFSGLEIAKLLGFPPQFSFPKDCSLKQQWRLLGNSLNVRVAARLCELGLRAKWAKGDAASV